MCNCSLCYPVQFHIVILEYRQFLPLVLVLYEFTFNWFSFSYVYVQYGFVNYALELLVVKTFDNETWEAIKYVINCCY